MTAKKKGFICNWDFSKGFGFVQTKLDDRTETFFLHHSKIQSGQPMVGAEVLFHQWPATQRGLRPQAINCEVGDIVEGV